MITTTAGQFLTNEALPEQLRDYGRVYDQKGLDYVLEQLAEHHPEKYREVSKKLADLGGEVAYRQGGLTFGLGHLARPAAAHQLAQRVQQGADLIWQNPRLDSEAKKQAVIKYLQGHQDAMRDASYGQALREKNPLAIQAAMGFRGSPGSIQSMLGSDLVYPDHKGGLIPYPITRSYSQGLSPLEFLASTFGSRQGVVSTKTSTAEAGALNKQLTQSAHQVMVSRDDQEGDWHHPDSLRGLPVKTGDVANIGSLLAHDVGPYKANTILTPKMLKELQQKGHENILVRSPMVGGTPDGGSHARDFGVRNQRGLPPAGSFIGIEAGQGIGEPLTQLQLGRKHFGSTAGPASKMGGFKLIEALANPPKNMAYGATHAQLDGVVDRIEQNPAGGYDVTVGGHKHYVPQDMELKVKPGNEVEAGDVLSGGVPNPREVVAHKGIGEGRRYLMNAMYDAYRDNKVGGRMLRRNLEPVVRGLVNHVTLTDFWGGHAPEDILNYNHVENNWSPRPGSELKSPRRAVGHYLESPVLHHSIGTRIRPSMMKEFENFGVNQIMVHPEPPPFVPTMLRATDNLQHDPDWQTRLGGQYLQKGLLDSAHRGLYSSPTGTSFIPALLKGDDIPTMMNKQPLS